MINNDEYIRYNYINKSLLGIVKTAQFKSKGQLQRAELAATLRINNIDIIKKLKKVISKDSFAVKLIKQLEIGWVEDFVIVKDLLTF